MYQNQSERYLVIFCTDRTTKACFDLFRIAPICHTAGSDIIQIYMEVLPGVPRVSKNQNFYLQIKLLSSCAKIAPKRHKLKKIVKIEKKSVKKTLFS